MTSAKGGGRWAGRVLIAVLLLVMAFLAGANAERYETFPIPQLKQANLSLQRLFKDEGDALYVDRVATERAAAFDWLTGDADIVMAGDSLTEQGHWDEMFPGVAIHNRGAGGDTIAGLSSRLAPIIAKKPEKVFLLIGINDVFAGSREDQFLARYDQVMVALAPHSRLHVQSIPYCARARCMGGRNAAVARINTGLQVLAKKHGAIWIDLNAALADGHALRGDVTADGVHLNGRGYQIWRALIAPYIVPAKASG